MKRILMLILCLVVFKFCFSQSPYGDLNGYKYIVINEVNSPCPKSSRNYIYNNLTRAGYNVIKEGELPSDFKKDPSLGLTCNVEISENWRGFYVSLILVNCYSNVLYKNTGHSGGLLSHAIRRVIKPLGKVNYHYDSNKRLFKPENTVQTNETEESIKKYLSSNILSPIEGIYKLYKQNKSTYYKIGVKREGNKFFAIILESELNIWKVGEVKASFEPTAISGYYSTTYYMGNKCKEETFSTIKNNCILEIELTDPISGVKSVSKFLKIFPQNIVDNEQKNKKIVSLGSGFFISENGLIATNAHVIKDAKEISVQLKIDNCDKEFKAKVILKDRINDVALIKIDDEKFKTYKEIPYNFCLKSNLGEDVFTLGFPMSNIMGNNLKVTNGIVSSITGINDDARYYQITAPIQPGSSGGALFNKYGDVIGITSAKLDDRAVKEDIENVNYAIKISYLMNLCNMLPEPVEIRNDKSILKGNDLQKQIELLKDFICIIKAK